MGKSVVCIVCGDRLDPKTCYYKGRSGGETFYACKHSKEVIAEAREKIVAGKYLGKTRKTRKA